MSKPKKSPAVSEPSTVAARWKAIAEEHGIVVRKEDQPEFVKFLERAQELDNPIEWAVQAFIGARAAMAGVFVGRQKAAGYLDDRKRGFTAARHAAIRADYDG